MASEPALVAHLLRRLTFGPRPGEIERYVDLEPDDIVRLLLDEPTAQPPSPELGSDDDHAILVRWWLDVMSSPAAGLHERMVWFWHGQITSSLDRADPRAMYRQHRVLREHALGNVRTLLREMAVDPAMLRWLDGAGSRAESPNENFGREVMELFALGHGAGYDEDDVRAAAVAFSGWWIDDDGEARFDETAGPSRPVRLLGVSVASASEAIDAICDHEACPSHIAGAVYEALVGVAPSVERRRDLAAVLRAADLEIRPLVEEIVTHPTFLDLSEPTPRSPVEWWIALRHLYDVELDPWTLHDLGQMPFHPPDVAGWPSGDRWISAGATFAKAKTAMDHAWDVRTLDPAAPVDDVLARAGLVEVSGSTRSALEAVVAALDGRRDLSTALHALVAMTPELSLK